MPFLEDTGVRTEEHRGPLVSAFSVLLEQIERMVLLNLVWAVQFVPVLCAYILSLPLAIRLILLACNGLMYFPLTGMLYIAIGKACDGELLRVDTVMDALRGTSRRSALVLAPLLVVFPALVLVTIWASSANFLLLDVLARLAILVLGVCSLYWGPLFAASSDSSAVFILRRSAALTFKYPLLTILTGCAVLLTMIIGTFSVGGLFLIVPVLIALIETQLSRHLTPYKRKEVVRNERA
jgi:hypothetical protein